MFRKFILTLAATAAIGTFAVMQTEKANANAKDTCGTPNSTAGCKTGDCYDGDKLQANGTWVSDASCKALAFKPTKKDSSSAKNQPKPPVTQAR